MRERKYPRVEFYYYLLIWFAMTFFIAGCMKKEPSQAAQRVFPVSVASVVQWDIPIYIETIGHVVAFTNVDVKPQVEGRVLEVYIKGGQDVQAGQSLYLIDPITYQIALERAKATLAKDEAQLEYARKRLQRYEQLIKTDFISKLNIEEYLSHVKMLEGQVRIDRAEVSLAQINLNHCKVVSPVEGRVNLTCSDPGNLVKANDSNVLTRILQITPVYVYFSLSQKEFQDWQHILAEGHCHFKALLPFGDSQQFEGEVIAIDNQLQTGTIQLKGIVPNRERILWPGEFVRVRLHVKMKNQVPVIPIAAIQIGQKGSFVYVLKPDMLVDVVHVKTGGYLDGWIAIDEGLQPGMKVIIDGQINLYPGAKVKIVERISDQIDKDQRQED